MPKQITQAELRDVVRAYDSLNRRMLQIRKRLSGGAVVEPGKWGARAEYGSDDTIPAYVGYSNQGLHICSPERIEQYRAVGA